MIPVSSNEAAHKTFGRIQNSIRGTFMPGATLGLYASWIALWPR